MTPPPAAGLEGHGPRGTQPQILPGPPSADTCHGRRADANPGRAGRDNRRLGRSRACWGEHPLLGELELHPGQELLITAIGENAPTQSDLVDALGVTQPTVARAVRRLTAAGFVETNRDHIDGRVVRVALTSQGRKLLPQIDQAWGQVDDRLLNALSRDEQKTLLSLLNRIGEPEDET